MEPVFGWTLLSRDALRRAETQLRDDVEGVRDEVGFLALHQGYADLFFPGTSVLHTRLRYALFVPWLYQGLIAQGVRQQVTAQLEKQEVILAGRLKQAGERGVIGGLSYPRPTTQPASMVYWTALGTWRILRPLPDGSYPSRAAIHRLIPRKSSRVLVHDDDRQLLDEDAPIFSGVPAAPKEWHDPAARLDLRLGPEETRFLRGCLLAVSRPGSEQAPSLLSRLVEKGAGGNPGLGLWQEAVLEAAGPEDRAALVRARQAAALSAVGRGVYAALVERLREEHDGVPTARTHRDNLAGVIATHAPDALRLDLDALLGDIPSLPAGIVEVLRATQAWLRKNRRDPASLLDVYERAESRRKGRRARLTRSLSGREKRREWDPDAHPLAAPLHYRWDNVRQLLADLGG